MATAAPAAATANKAELLAIADAGSAASTDPFNPTPVDCDLRTGVWPDAPEDTGWSHCRNPARSIAIAPRLKEVHGT